MENFPFDDDVLSARQFEAGIDEAQEAQEEADDTSNQPRTEEDE